ncbi:MAG: hypothetical protein J1G02_01110 [Clostridiales bacterium]|nr:hypothetical protein [Clostridiales bacterium]
MIEEVVNSILEAEDVAKRRVADAEVKAGEIIAQAEMQAESMKRNATQSNKEYQAQRLSQADAQAEKEADKLLDELKAKTDSELSVLEKRVEKTVKVILESL